MLAEAARICDTLGAGRFVFNLGHGIVPETSPENVAALSAFLKQRDARA
jgi:uroporphyrinogen decarboxylase